MATIRVYLPCDLTIPDDHVAMVMEEEWKQYFYDFGSETAFGMHAARLMTVAGLNEYGQPLRTRSLADFDGHGMHRTQALGTLTLAPMNDPGWTLAGAIEFFETAEEQLC